MNFKGQSEINSKLLQEVGDNLTAENFNKMKNHCKVEEYGRLGVGQLEKINTPSDLFQKLQQKAVFKEGDYRKLKSLLKLCESDDAVEIVEKAERALFQAGHPVVGFPFPGSDAAMQNYEYLASQYATSMHKPPPYSQTGEQFNPEYHQSHGHQQYFGEYSKFQQPPGELFHRSDAHPSMGQQHAGYSGGHRMPTPGHHPNQSNLMTQGNQFVATSQPHFPMQGTSPELLTNPNINQSCSLGNVVMMDADEYYDVQRKGFVLFINNHFNQSSGMSAGSGTSRYEYREGAEIDTVHVKDTFLNRLTNHELAVEEEVGKNKFWGILDDAHDKLRRGNYSSFILIISSHGIQEETNKDGKIFKRESIVLVDESFVTLDEIKEKFNGINAPFLIGKPKVFVIQACRGVDVGRAVPDRADCSGGDPAPNVCESGTLSRPENADVLVAYATSAGTRAWRNKEEGTWYINHLCRALREKRHRDHFLDMLLRVHNQISSRDTNTPDPAKQMPCCLFTITKKFCVF